jgi:YebC/PmpR family DNA-binding regulatory protein
MPSDNIERAIKKGAGATEGTSFVEMVLEGYGPSGAAILVQAVSDNRNRTVQDVRNIFSRNGGNLSESGSVAWIFEQKGLIRIPLNNQNSEELELQAIDAGAEDVKVEDSELEIYTKLEDMERIRRALQEKNIPIDSSELVMNSKNMVDLDERASLQTLRLLERLEELDEVQHVHTNADFPAEILEKYKAQVH